MRDSTLRHGKTRKGTAAVEFVLILPLLTTMVFGAIDFGRFAYTYIAVNNAARAAAGYGMMNSYTTLSSWQSAVQTAATNEMSQQTGFVSANLTVTSTSYTDGTGLRRVHVTTSYPFTTLVNWPSIPKNTTLLAAVDMRAVR